MEPRSADERHESLLQGQHPSDAPSSTGAAGARRGAPAVASSSSSRAAKLDAIINESGFGKFQWKVCVLVGAMVYVPAGWIMLPVFVNPQLARQLPAVFTERRCVRAPTACFCLLDSLAAPFSPTASAAAD